MEVKEIKPSAEVAYQIDSDQEVKLTVRYMGLDEAIDFIHKGENPKPSEMNREMLISSVLGWDLTKDGQPVPCTDENKRKYLPFILGRKTMDGSVIAWELLAFVRDEANFLGN
jgi:hypothetical protein